MLIEKSALSTKLNKLKSVVPGKQTQMQSMQGVLFKDNSLTAYNMEIGMRTGLETDTDESFIIPLTALDLIAKLPDGMVEMTLDNKNILTIKASGTKSKHVSIPVDQFPELPTIKSKDSEKTIIDGEQLAGMISKVMYAIAVDNSKPILTGLLFKSDGSGTLDLVGCDGYRVSWAKMEYGDEANFVVPKLPLQKLLSLGLTGNVEILHDNNLAIFNTGEYCVVTRLLEGNYIDYKRIFPNHQNITVIERKPFLDAVERTILSTFDEKSKTPIKVKVDTDQLVVSCKSSISEYTETIELQQPAMETVTIGFNPKYLQESLRTFDSEQVTLKFGGSVAPMIIDDNDLTGLLLPVRIKEDAADE